HFPRFLGLPLATRRHSNDMCSVLDVQLYPPLRSRDRYVESLPWAEGDERITQQRSAAVAGGERDRVLDRDVIAENVSVADVAGVLFGVEVEAAEVGVLVEGDREGIVLAAGAPGVAVVVICLAARLGIPAAVELQVAEGEHALRVRAHPPVDQVEMVRRLVEHQAAGLVLLAVPAAEE